MAPRAGVSHPAEVSTWTSAAWTGEDFLADLRAFVVAAVGDPDAIELVALRPWSAVWRVSAGGRASYAKQNCPGQAHEAALVATLARIAPEQLVPVLAADPERDLLLTADVGPTLEAQGRGGDVETWCRLVREAALLQRRVLDSGVDLGSDPGLTVLAASDAATYVANAVGHLAALDAFDPRRLETGLAQRLGDLIPLVDRWADQVDDLGLPPTLVHNDLHASNVVATNGAPLRFFDFGDAVVCDPLANLLLPLHVAQRDLRAAGEDPRLWRVADAALEVWSDLAPLDALRAALPAALQLGRLARVESWRRCVATMTVEERADWGHVPAHWLALLLREPPISVRTGAGRT